MICQAHSYNPEAVANSNDIADHSVERQRHTRQLDLAEQSRGEAGELSSPHAAKRQ
jgi:hypothetical protein